MMKLSIMRHVLQKFAFRRRRFRITFQRFDLRSALIGGHLALVAKGPNVNHPSITSLHLQQQ
jgi:hypothetical protein